MNRPFLYYPAAGHCEGCAASRAFRLLTVADAYRGRVFGVYGLTAAGMGEFGGMQAGFLAEWTSAPFALQVGAVVVALVALFFLGPRLRRLHEAEHG